MKRSLFALAAAALLLLGASDAFAQTATRTTGAKLTGTPPVNGTSTYDYVDFGFWANHVKLCLNRGESGSRAHNQVYIRLGNAVAQLVTNYGNSLTGDRMTVPVSSSAAFIGGDSGGLNNRAMAFTAPVSNAVVSSSGMVDSVPQCHQFAWRTKGIVMHVPVGVATVDVTAWE